MSLCRFALKVIACALALGALSAPPASAAGGISLQSTRVVYPLGAKQTTVAVKNSSTTDSFMVQSWVNNPGGEKSRDFVVTPPLYISGPNNENTLRLMLTGANLPRDRESLYYLNVKAIPSLDKQALKGKNMLLLAANTRIKLFVRPTGLIPAVNEAPKKLTFRRQGNMLEIVNPTPYYITITNMKAGNQALGNIMVAPQGSGRQPLTAGSANVVTWQTINDYGAVTPEIKSPIR
ncbi:Pili assembly chaperone [Sodalis praecaptivus]|uniref:Pili assembly chaperone n=1 Tax=Sodalis praecaptivus TaxID=1239307 RepID=W0HT60_9GAMM|nr:fimbria/pilus periplasmic chaperone [Sodalis praecaptivus]AHF77001.1 Pili assembly chaperone [Sodalis praecaptivus]